MVTCHDTGVDGDDYRGFYQYPTTMRDEPAVTSNGLLILRDSSGDISVTALATLDETIYSCGLDVDTASTLPEVNESEPF